MLSSSWPQQVSAMWIMPPNRIGIQTGATSDHRLPPGQVLPIHRTHVRMVVGRGPSKQCTAVTPHFYPAPPTGRAPVTPDLVRRVPGSSLYSDLSVGHAVTRSPSEGYRPLRFRCKTVGPTHHPAEATFVAENRLYYGDNLDVLRQHVATESVDLVYLDRRSTRTAITTCCLANTPSRERQMRPRSGVR
jgi:hypothetical protein